jgi:glycosyltransferase involved in cell wall biosynthesis
VQRCYLGADAMICNCRANEEEALACGMPADRLHYVPNAVDPDRFRPARTDESSDIRRAEGWPVTARICVYVGRLSREKGVLDLLEAWRSMHRSGDLLVLVGPDMPGPLDAGPAARQFVADHGLAASVRFHGESTDTARLLRAADVYVQPSHYESFSNALIEAMATGLPLAASRVGGMLDCVVDGENGRLFAPGDASDLARVLGPLMRDPIAAARLGVRARETVLARFQQTVIARDLAAIFTATAARYSTAAARAERTSGGPGRAA